MSSLFDSINDTNKRCHQKTMVDTLWRKNGEFCSYSFHLDYFIFILPSSVSLLFLCSRSTILCLTESAICRWLAIQQTSFCPMIKHDKRRLVLTYFFFFLMTSSIALVQKNEQKNRSFFDHFISPVRFLFFSCVAAQMVKRWAICDLEGVGARAHTRTNTNFFFHSSMENIAECIQCEYATQCKLLHYLFASRSYTSLNIAKTSLHWTLDTKMKHTSISALDSGRQVAALKPMHFYPVLQSKNGLFFQCAFCLLVQWVWNYR